MSGGTSRLRIWDVEIDEIVSRLRGGDVSAGKPGGDDEEANIVTVGVWYDVDEGMEGWKMWRRWKREVVVAAVDVVARSCQMKRGTHVNKASSNRRPARDTRAFNVPGWLTCIVRIRAKSNHFVIGQVKPSSKQTLPPSRHILLRVLSY